MRDNNVVEGCGVTGIPPATPLREATDSTATLATEITSMTLTVVAQRARANPGARVRECPDAVRCGQPGPTSLIPVREVADVMAVGVPRFNGKFATVKTNPDRRMCFGTGQGGAFQRSCAPARYPRMRTDRGGDCCTASLARRSGRRHPQELMPPILASTYDRPDQTAPARQTGRQFSAPTLTQQVPAELPSAPRCTLSTSAREQPPVPAAPIVRPRSWL
ncbi:hypothetical protein MLGJGCBP_02971 [Rhodococcus sp. T7]|nr:hypothetical protein MLGJGCBP_09419 [Rhodococcus sp. T7]KAF0963897.1 hypothetical protein MLGJGCBP_02971 [Rhodococcus sp. T7]